MNDHERIVRIRNARTEQELDRATEGYRDQVLQRHPDLVGNCAFNAALNTRQYFHALGDVKRAQRGGGNKYEDVILVLQCASEKQFSLTKY
jgi:hypothetical protein